jgi:pyrimidine-specific ribonucleoside hydrolase
MSRVVLLSVLIGVSHAVADGHDAIKARHEEHRPFLALRALPMSAESYQPHVAELVRAGIPEKFGHQEWTAIVLTHEVHQHAGIYSILGAKMATRAAELLNAPKRAVKVTAECGTNQPLSCFIDGIQVALGSTLGQGLIKVPDTNEPRIAATFEYKSKQLRLALKAEAEHKVKDFIATSIEEHGNLTAAYFEAVEEHSYRVWADFDRSLIFEERWAGTLE